jgi:hypothetical protein
MHTTTPKPENSPLLLASIFHRPGLAARTGTSTRDAPAGTVTRPGAPSPAAPASSNCSGSAAAAGWPLSSSSSTKIRDALPGCNCAVGTRSRMGTAGSPAPLPAGKTRKQARRKSHGFMMDLSCSRTSYQAGARRSGIPPARPPVLAEWPQAP